MKSPSDLAVPTGSGVRECRAAAFEKEKEEDGEQDDDTDCSVAVG